MAKSALPLLLIAGGAAVMMTKKKKRRRTSASAAEPDIPSLEEAEEEEPEPEPSPQPEETVDPEEAFDPEPELEEPEPPGPSPSPIPTPEPGPSDPKLPQGPTGVGSCVNNIYNRATEYIDPAVVDVLSPDATTAWPDKEYYFYMRRPAQLKLYNAVANRFLKQIHEEDPRTVGPVILREELDKLGTSCDWGGDTNKMDEPSRLIWSDAKKIATLAAMMTGFRDPAGLQLFKTSKRFTVTRESLNMPDPGFLGAQKGLELGQRVEIIATEGDTLENAEHLIGMVTKLTGPENQNDQFEIRIVGTFQGKDVRPKLTDHHGFKVLKTQPLASSNAYFSKSGPTGVYRIYPVGLE